MSGDSDGILRRLAVSLLSAGNLGDALDALCEALCRRAGVPVRTLDREGMEGMAGAIWPDGGDGGG